MVTRRVTIETDRQTEQVFELAIFLDIKFGLLSCCMLLVTCILKYLIIIPTIKRKYSSGRVVAKLAWINVLVGDIRIGPGVGQRFGSPRVKARSWQKGILVTLVAVVG